MDHHQDFRKALNFAIKALSRRSHTANELKIKLLRNGYSEEVSKEVINYCQERHYIDDVEYARQWIRDRLRFKPRGKKLIFQELRQKGVAASIIQAILDDLLSSEEELNLAVELLRKKISKISKGDGLDERKKMQLYRFLVSKGFNSETINKAMGLALKENQ